MVESSTWVASRVSLSRTYGTVGEGVHIVAGAWQSRRGISTGVDDYQGGETSMLFAVYITKRDKVEQRVKRQLVMKPHPFRFGVIGEHMSTAEA
jgi:hypothetical protein